MTLLLSKRSIFLTVLAIGALSFSGISFSEVVEPFSDSELLGTNGESFYTCLPDSGFEFRDPFTKSIVLNNQQSEPTTKPVTKGKFTFYIEDYQLLMKDTKSTKTTVLVASLLHEIFFCFDTFFICQDEEGNVYRFDYTGKKTAFFEYDENGLWFEKDGTIYIDKGNNDLKTLYRCTPSQKTLSEVLKGKWEYYMVNEGKMIYVQDNNLYINHLDGKPSQVLYASKVAFVGLASRSPNIFWMTNDGVAMRADSNGQDVQVLFDKNVKSMASINHQIAFEVCSEEGGVFINEWGGTFKKLFSGDVKTFNLLGDSLVYLDSSYNLHINNLKTQTKSITDYTSRILESNLKSARLIQDDKQITVIADDEIILLFNKEAKLIEEVSVEGVQSLGGSEIYSYYNLDNKTLCKRNFRNGKVEIIGTFVSDYENDITNYCIGNSTTITKPKEGYYQCTIKDKTSGKVIINKKLVEPPKWIGDSTLMLIEKCGDTACIGIFNAKSKKYVTLEKKHTPDNTTLVTYQFGKTTFICDNDYLYGVVNTETGASNQMVVNIDFNCYSHIKGTTLTQYDDNTLSLIFINLKTRKKVTLSENCLPDFANAELIGNHIYLYSEAGIFAIYDLERDKLSPFYEERSEKPLEE